MTRAAKRKGERWGLILAILGVSVMVVLFVKDRNKLNALRSKHEHTTGTITEYVNQFGRAGGSYRYIFYVKGQRVESSSRITNVAKNRAHLLVGKGLPVFYNPDNPHNNQMLIFPADFEWLGLPFPDSLEWVRAYEY